MKYTKESVLEYICQAVYTRPECAQGVQTAQVAQALQMQRSNVSTLLNQLVKEEKLIKTSTRPVLYRPKEQLRKSSESSCFSKMVGDSGSLRNAIRQAKAAILYPNRSLNVAIASAGGCGTTCFAQLMYQFAVENGILRENAPFVKVNCRDYGKNVAVLEEELMGRDGLGSGVFGRARGGVLFIDCFDLLNVKQQSRVFKFLETGRILTETEMMDCSDVYLILSCSTANISQLEHKIPVIVELPELKNRPLEERYQLLGAFFMEEAANFKRPVSVDCESVRALLLAEYSYNVKELRREIRSACANAYVRVMHDMNRNINVGVNDFSANVRKGLLRKKTHGKELQVLLGDGEYILYDENTALSYKREEPAHEVSPDSREQKQLGKLVDNRLVTLLTDCLETYRKESGCTFSSRAFSGVCYYLDQLLQRTDTASQVSNDEIVAVIQNHPEAYALATMIAQRMRRQFSREVELQETVRIALLLAQPEEQVEDIRPVLLYVLHGTGIAQALRDTTNALTHCDNAYAFDLAMDSDAGEALEELRSLITQIDRGAGVIVIYDMGSIKTMLETIAEETEVKIRSFNIPITMVGMALALKCASEGDIDMVYHSASLEMREYTGRDMHQDTAIITLCHTGEGAALQLKNYLDRYSRLHFRTIALSMSNRRDLLKEVLQLKRTYNIHAFVGTYDPKILGIPFIPMVNVFEAKKSGLDRVLMFEPNQNNTVDYSGVYAYLEESFRYTSVSKLKTVLPKVMDELSVIYALPDDQMLGIFMHLACCVERLLSGGTLTPNPEAEKIIAALADDYRVILKAVKRLEKAFKIIFDNNEVANLIMMVKQI